MLVGHFCPHGSGYGSREPLNPDPIRIWIRIKMIQIRTPTALQRAYIPYTLFFKWAMLLGGGMWEGGNGQPYGTGEKKSLLPVSQKLLSQFFTHKYQPGNDSGLFRNSCTYFFFLRGDFSCLKLPNFLSLCTKMEDNFVLHILTICHNSWLIDVTHIHMSWRMC